MSRLYVGPLSGVELEPLAGFLLWPGKKVSLPEASPYTQALVAEGWLGEDQPASYVISAIQEAAGGGPRTFVVQGFSWARAVGSMPRSFLVLGPTQGWGFGSIPSHFIVTI